MTLDEIKNAIELIVQIKGDDERAHSEEDELRAGFIQHVAANGPADLAAMTREVLKTDEIDFARWCA